MNELVTKTWGHREFNENMNERKIRGEKNVRSQFVLFLICLERVKRKRMKESAWVSIIFFDLTMFVFTLIRSRAKGSYHCYLPAIQGCCLTIQNSNCRTMLGMCLVRRRQSAVSSSYVLTVCDCVSERRSGGESASTVGRNN